MHSAVPGVYFTHARRRFFARYINPLPTAPKDENRSEPFDVFYAVQAKAHKICTLLRTFNVDLQIRSYKTKARTNIYVLNSHVVIKRARAYIYADR
jgi:hypothetical protein